MKYFSSWSTEFYVPLHSLKKDQHCILFSSENLKITQLADSYRFTSLNANLRSTCEIISFVESYRKNSLLKKKPEIECKPAHNFHGEPVDVRRCTNEFDFVRNSIETIEEYLAHSRGLAFLPVITSIPEHMLSWISSSLAAKQIKVDRCESLYNKTLDTTLKTLPSVYFFDIQGLEGVEFAVAVILLYDSGYGDGRAQLFFHNIITRACTKLVFVKAAEKKLEKRERTKLINLALEEKLKLELEGMEPSSILFLVGTNFEFSFVTPISQSKLKERNICLPKIEGVQHFEGPNDVIILQKEDLYRNKDVKALITAGMKSIIIVGGKIFSYLQKRFYFYTDSVLSSQLYSGQFQIANFTYIYDTDGGFSSHLDRFLTETDSKKTGELQTLSGIDEDSEVDELLCSNEPYFKWKNWKQKASESSRLLLPSSLVSNLYSNVEALLNNEQRNYYLSPAPNTVSFSQYRKVLVKISNSLLKLYSSEISKPSYILKNLNVAPDEVYSFQWFAFEALSRAEKVIKFHPLRVKTFHRIYRVIKIVQAKQKKDVQAKQVVSEDDLRSGLRHLEKIENFPDRILSQIYDLYLFQREHYEDEIILNKKNAKQEQIVQNVCELSTLFLAHIKKEEVEEESIQTRLESFQIILRFVIHRPIRFALEALEWNPTHKPALEALNQSFSFFATILNEIYNIASKIEKRETFNGNRFQDHFLDFCSLINNEQLLRVPLL